MRLLGNGITSNTQIIYNYIEYSKAVPAINADTAFIAFFLNKFTNYYIHIKVLFTTYYLKGTLQTASITYILSIYTPYYCRNSHSNCNWSKGHYIISLLSITDISSLACYQWHPLYTWSFYSLVLTILKKLHIQDTGSSLYIFESSNTILHSFEEMLHKQV